MNRLLLIATIALMLFSACSVNTGTPQTNSEKEAYTGVVTKVAILPLKTMDARSRNVKKILTVRDFDYAFSKHPQFELLNMDAVAAEFKTLGFVDVDDLDPEELNEAAEAIGANVILAGNIATVNPQVFAISMKLFSARTGDLKQLNFQVSNMKEKRWEILESSMIKDMDAFISTEVDKIFNIATNFYAGANYVEAEKQLKLAIGLAPEKLEAQYYLGATYYKTNQFALAETTLNKVLEKDPAHLQSLYTLDEMFEKNGDTLKRIGIMEKRAALNQDKELWLNIANLYAENKMNAKAEAALKSALAIDKDFVLATTRLAFLLFEDQRFADAVPYLETAYDSFPENDLISRRLAVSYQKSGRMDAAIARYEGLIRNNPDNAAAYLNLVSLYRNQASEATDPAIVNDLNTKAINAMNNLKRIDPENAMAYLNLASIYLSQGKNADAETNANTTIQKDSSLYQPYLILATISQTKGTNEYNRFTDLEKKAAKAVGKQATTLSRDRDAAKSAAITQFREAAQLLNAAKSRAKDAETVTDINNRLTRINSLISSASGY